MALADDLAYMTASEMALHIRRRDFSPVEVIDASIERIEKRNAGLNAFIFKGYDDARKEAKAAEKALLTGAELGPLHGVPTAIKDLFDFKPGWPYTFGGVRAMKDCIAHWHCVFAERIEKGGAIILGKTNSPTMGLRGTTDNYLFGPSRNPFNPSKNTGGSSGGSAAAVADGLVPFAEGTDAGGSIRIPAAWCGVVGYRASVGRIPVVMRPNAFGGDLPYVFEGPISRTVEDAALALNVLAGYDSRDPLSIETDEDFVAATRRSIKGWKIAYSPDLDIYPVAAEVRATMDKAVEAFAEAGATVERVKLGLKRTQMELSDAWCRLMQPLNLGGLEGMKAAGIDLLGKHRDDFPPDYLHWIEVGQKLTAMDIVHDQAIRSEVYDALQGVLANHDVLVSPTLACMPVDNLTNGETRGPTSINGENIDPLIGWCMTFITNFSGHPSISIPAGMSGGLPVGMHILGRLRADSDVLAAAAAFERLRPWKDTYRICAERKL
ncbi:MAG TPA: amidase [Magnetospirillaceae bacterium]|jgi:amidase/aspartyl-tRNA(Asn)/glutamyl-tRNA(Gln) amidotransferase subunit A